MVVVRCNGAYERLPIALTIALICVQKKVRQDIGTYVIPSFLPFTEPLLLNFSVQALSLCALPDLPPG